MRVEGPKQNLTIARVQRYELATAVSELAILTAVLGCPASAYGRRLLGCFSTIRTSRYLWPYYTLPSALTKMRHRLRTANAVPYRTLVAANIDVGQLVELPEK